MSPTKELSDCLPPRALIAAPHQVLVIGAGVSGLKSALCLARNGFRVKILAEELASHVTSVVAGALWEWPPAVCGQHQDRSSLKRSKLFLRPVNFYFKRPIAEDENSRPI
jgi:D-amino-acid oxidase